MSVILKIKCQNEVHRITLSEENLNFASVIDSVKSIYKTCNIIVKYRDSDNDLCTLCPSAFSDFLSHAIVSSDKKTLKVEVLETQMEKSIAEPILPGHGSDDVSLNNVHDVALDSIHDRRPYRA